MSLLFNSVSVTIVPGSDPIFDGAFDLDSSLEKIVEKLYESENEIDYDIFLYFKGWEEAWDLQHLSLSHPLRIFIEDRVEDGWSSTI